MSKAQEVLSRIEAAKDKEITVKVTKIEPFKQHGSMYKSVFFQRLMKDGKWAKAGFSRSRDDFIEVSQETKVKVGDTFVTKMLPNGYLDEPRLK